MKVLISGIVLIALCAIVYSETNIEDLSAAEILQNSEYFEIYSKCIFDKGDCTEDATKVKGRIADAFKDGCKSCTPEETEELKVIFKFLVEEKPDLWKQLTDKLDADGSNKSAYENLLP